MRYRILITGSRDFDDVQLVETTANHWMPDRQSVLYVHGDCPQGPDAVVKAWCDLFGIPQEFYPGKDFPSFQDRNQHMVDLGADVCLAFATKWASGTGQTARMARKAGIKVIDYGVDTT